MLISKFNKMIRNRLLWGIFAVIISISFVGLFTSSGGCEGAEQADAVVGTVDDLSVTQSELQRARFFTMLQLSLMMGRPFAGHTPEMMREFEDMSWRRALALKKAESLGLRVSNLEVVTHIEQDPMFSAEGRFQKRFYDQFADVFLRQVGVSRRQYDDYVRDEIMLEKLMRVLAVSTWIAPRELEQHLRTYTDLFTVQTVRFSPEPPTPVAEPDLAEIEAFFAEDPELFALPERVRVAYVSFMAEDYVEGLEVDEEDVENYYADHLAEFRRAKDEKEEDDRDQNGAPEWEDAYLPFEDVADDIRDRLRQRQALFAAMDAATDFVLRLVPKGRADAALGFNQVAGLDGLPVMETVPFDRFDPPAELSDVAPDVLARHAFRLEDNPSEYFSDAIAGETAAYVLALRERIPAGVPEIDEVLEDVRDALVGRRTETQALEHAVEVRRQIMATMLDEPSLSLGEAVAEHGLTALEFEAFSVFDAPEELEDMELLQAITACNPGEFTDLITGQQGTLKMAYVVEREPAEEMSRNMLRRQLGSNLYRHRSQMVFAEWQENLLQRLRKKTFEDQERDERDNMGRRPIL